MNFDDKKNSLKPIKIYRERDHLDLLLTDYYCNSQKSFIN